MRTNLIVVLLLVFMGSSLVVEAQIGRRLKRAVERGVQNAVENKVEEEAKNATERQLDKAFENLYGPEDERSDSERAAGLSRMMQSVSMHAETKDAYGFSGYAEMELTGTEADGKTIDPIRINSFFHEQENHFGMEFSDKDKSSEKSIMVFDLDNEVTVILMENNGERSSMAMALDWNQMSEVAFETAERQSEHVDPDQVSFEKTGRTKTIHGYVCDEYAYESESEKGSYWVSRSSSKGMNTLWGSNNPFMTERLENMNPEYVNMLPKGDVLEIWHESKIDQSSMHIKVIDLEENKAVDFNMADYPNIMQAGMQ